MDLFPAHTDGGGKFSTAPRQGREGFPLLPESALKVRFLLAKALQKFPHHGRKRGVPFRRLQSGPAVKGVFNCNCDIFHIHIFTFYYRLSKRFEGISHFGLVFVVSEGAKEGHGLEFRLRLKKILSELCVSAVKKPRILPRFIVTAAAQRPRWVCWGQDED
jgi:hypothetical protein